MGRVQTRRQPAIARITRNPDIVLRRLARVLRLRDAHPDCRQKSLKGRVPREIAFPTVPSSRGRRSGRTGRLSGRALLCAYFQADSQPYRRWFNSYEPFLNAVGASYYGSQPSTALHTDICSTVATDPTWGPLHETDKCNLGQDGVPLWHDLLNVLKPQLVVVSVAKEHLERIKFRPLSNWENVHVFDRKKDGSRRQTPVKVQGRRYEVSGEPSLFVFVTASRTPMPLDDGQKREAGTKVRDLMGSGFSPSVQMH